MRSPSPLAQAVAAHGRDLAVLRSLFEEAARDTSRLCAPRGRPPKGTAMSALTRDKFLELVESCADLGESGVAVKPCGEDWVRVWLPELKAWVPLRHRPGTVVYVTEDGLFDDDEFDADRDLLGWPSGSPFLFWDWSHKEGRLLFYGVAWVISKQKWVIECRVRHEIEISSDLVALPASSSVPSGARNDDDDLRDIVSRWESDEPESEEEVTDRADESARDDRANPAMGEDTN